MPDEPPEKKDKALVLKVSDGSLEFGSKRAMLMDIAGGLYALKKTLRADIGVFERDFLLRAGEAGAREFLSAQLSNQDLDNPKSAIEKMLTLYSMRGYGNLRLEKFDPERHLIEVTCPNTAEAWAYQENNDLQSEPMCSYTSGMLKGVCRLACAREAQEDADVAVHESECIAHGSRQCRFFIGPSRLLSEMFPKIEIPKGSISEHELKLNEEILLKNLELQNINLSLERQIRKRTEDVWRAEENYSSLMRHSPDPIAIILTNGKFHSINPPGLKMLGLDSSEVAQAHSIEKYLAKGKEGWEKLIFQIEKEGAANGVELEMLKSDGTPVSALVSARFAELVPGRCVETVFKDLSEMKRMELQVTEARSESEFLNDLLSHDIMNFTFSGMHFLNKLWKSARITDEDRRDLAMVMKDVQGAYELTSSVRDLSKIKDLGDEGLIIKDLKHIVVEGIEEAKRLFPDRAVRINFEKSVEPRYVRCTPLATRLFTNLLTNAIKYTPTTPVVVDVDVDNIVEDGTVFWRVRITDSGRGIPDEEKERIFDRFTRLDTTVPGTGLGLYVARFIAKAGGGRLWAENRVPGDHTKGSVMVVLMRKAEEREIARMPRRT